ncbi:MAG: PAS domain S-box protein [Candidatus Sericytochromatia bacterium]|nr:PAS domain S-box protein [Candidatus Sericytochromatia bacterium]
MAQTLANHQAFAIARQHAADKLTKANQDFQTLIDASPYAVVVLNLQFEVVMWSPAAERICGWRSTDVLGRVVSFVPADQIDEFESLLTVLAGGRRQGRLASWPFPGRSDGDDQCGRRKYAAHDSRNGQCPGHGGRSNALQGQAKRAGQDLRCRGALGTIDGDAHYGACCTVRRSCGPRSRLRNHCRMISPWRKTGSRAG